MNFNAKMGIGAVMKLVVRKADTDEIVRETPEFHNLVLTTGLARMAAGTWIDRCCVGTGNTPPIESHTALASFIASTTSTATGQPDAGGIQVTTEPFYWFGRRTWRFNVGVATGNISEVGLGWGNSNLWNKALIKDAQGNPTTIPVLADEYLDVISEVRVYPKRSEGAFNVVNKQGNIISSHTFKSFPVIKNSLVPWSAGKVAIGDGGVYSTGFYLSSSPMAQDNSTNIPSVIFTKNISPNETSPLPNGVKVSFVVTSSEANGAGPHRSFQTLLTQLMQNHGAASTALNSASSMKWEVTPPIPKDIETILTYSFTVSWSNYVP